MAKSATRTKYLTTEQAREKFPNTIIGQKVRIADTAVICDNVIIMDNVTVGNDTYINHNVIIGRSSHIGSRVTIDAFSTIETGVVIGNDVKVCSNVQIGTDSRIGDFSCIGVGVMIQENVVIEKNCMIYNHSLIMNRARICNGSCLEVQSHIGQSAKIDIKESYAKDLKVSDGTVLRSNHWYMTLGPIGTRGSYFTVTWNKKEGYRFYVGCQRGMTLKKFKERLEGEYGPDKQERVGYEIHAYNEYTAAIAYIEACPKRHSPS